MKENNVKARKDHKCDACDNPILKGQLHRFEKHRSPKYDHNDEQVGIVYWSVRTHPDKMKCYWPEECRKGNHVIDEYYDLDQESDTCGQTFYFCSVCSTHKEDIDKHNLSFY
jgi:hypothetical protein